MWKENLWKNWEQKISSQSLLKTFHFSTPACGQKSLGVLKHSPFIHIIFYYDSCYYLLSCKYILIRFFNKERKKLHALYL